jgi:hypothetical protein
MNEDYAYSRIRGRRHLSRSLGQRTGQADARCQRRLGMGLLEETLAEEKAAYANLSALAAR